MTTRPESGTQPPRDVAQRRTSRWRLILEPFGEPSIERPSRLGGARNMAVDQALLESVAQGGRPALRFYQWRIPCLSLGRNQSADAFLEGIEAAPDMELVRRPTGGTAVLHDRELTYAVVVPVRWLGGPRATYHAIHEALVQGLNTLGVPAATRPVARRARRRIAAVASAVSGDEASAAWVDGAESADPTCFAATAPGEVTVGGRKLVGSAQRCERRAILQHGSLLLEAGQSQVARIGGMRAGAIRGRETSLHEILGSAVSLGALMDALTEGFRARLGIDFERTSLTVAERARAHELDARFVSEGWTRRT